MTIVFDHAVKYNGKYYPANTKIEKSLEKCDETVEKSLEKCDEGVKNPKKGKVKKDG